VDLVAVGGAVGGGDALCKKEHEASLQGAAGGCHPVGRCEAGGLRSTMEQCKEAMHQGRRLQVHTWLGRIQAAPAMESSVKLVAGELQVGGW
jgi:hypothetical protein